MCLLGKHGQNVVKKNVVMSSIAVLTSVLPPLVFAKTTAAAVLASALLPLVFAKTAAAAVLASALLPPVFAKTTARKDHRKFPLLIYPLKSYFLKSSPGPVPSLPSSLDRPPSEDTQCPGQVCQSLFNEEK